MRGAKGPIFEDGPNFDVAFRLFHGRDGVVPLSGSSYVRSENLELNPPAPQFNPLAAKAATISLSGFGVGGPFSFDAFSGKWKNQKKKSQSSKKESSSKVGTFLVVSYLCSMEYSKSFFISIAYLFLRSSSLHLCPCFHLKSTN